MKEYQIIRIHDHPEMVERAAEWFHQKWGIPKSAYLGSMEESMHSGTAVPKWYVVLSGDMIVGGLGVIENDFHARKDLAPNVCAVYVEKEFRGQGIAGMMLDFACEEFAEMGVYTLYLLTDHTGYYERYGWEFLCMVQGDGDEELSRMYVHTSSVSEI